MVLVKNLKFCERSVLCKIHTEKVFGDVLVRKQAFVDNINRDLKRRQNWHVWPLRSDKGSSSCPGSLAGEGAGADVEEGFEGSSEGRQ